MTIDFGSLNGHAIGHIMKKAVMLAIDTIRVRQFTRDIQEKAARPSGASDFVTDADKAAQKTYLRILRESFPTFGIVAEEDDLSIPCTHPTHDIWFTIDPLDGTSAFIRQQSTGVGTMLALVCDSVVIAAYVGDVMSGEIFGYRPGSTGVSRITEHGPYKQLIVDERRTLASQYVLLREHPMSYPPSVRQIIGASAHAQNRFRNLEIGGGSIGIAMARLWKGEVGAYILEPGLQNPWDIVPIYGISRHLGFVYVAIQTDLPLRITPLTFIPSKTAVPFDHPHMIVHASRLPEIDGAWFGV